jgi:hypothetical protein
MPLSNTARTVTFNGDEEGVIRLDGLHQLSGVHASLLGAALQPGEVIEHILLCPWWDCSTKPFGVEPMRASHTLCLTKHRLVVTRHYLDGRTAPATVAIDRCCLVGLELGQALLMSWLALHVRRDRTITKEGLYFPTRGNKYVTDLLRDLRRSWPAYDTLVAATSPVSPCTVFGAAGYFHERLLRPLLLEDERCLRVSQRLPIWGHEAGWWGRLRPIGLAHRGTLLLTDRSFVYVCGKPGLGPKDYVFDHNLVCFPLSALTRVEHERDRTDGVGYSRIRLAVGTDGGNLDVLLPKNQADLAAEWYEELGSLVNGVCGPRWQERTRS